MPERVLKGITISREEVQDVADAVCDEVTGKGYLEPEVRRDMEAAVLHAFGFKSEDED